MPSNWTYSNRSSTAPSDKMADRWSKERIVVAIQSRQKHDPSLRHVCKDDQGLYYAAFRFFGSWRNAVLAAGAKPYHRRWTKQSIVQAIRARHEQGVAIRGITGEDQALYSASYRHFGGWPRAMLAAGLSWEPKRWLSREQVLTAIQSRHQQGLSLYGVSKTECGLAYAARKYFGTWSTAVTAAGIPDGWQYTWSRTRLIAAIQACGEQGQPLENREVPSTLRRVAYKYFGCWQNALAAAGRTPPAPRPSPHKRWTKEGVLAAIRLRSRQGLAMTIAANQTLARAANRRFGTWHEALRAAGVAPNARRIWTPQRVLEEIQAWHRRGAFTKDNQLEDNGLIIAARRRFGSWNHALVAAGVRLPHEDETRRWKWPRQRIIESIQDRYVQGVSMIADHDKSLAGAAIRVFGSWHAAMIAAGIPVGETPKPRRKWTRKAVLQEIVARYMCGLEMAKVRATEHALVCAAHRHFGSWRHALVAAGLAAKWKK